jgi:hypothetical protein
MKTQRINRIVAMAAAVLVTLETGRVCADFICSVPVKVPNVNNRGSNLGGSVSPDGLEMYFTSERDGNFDLYVSRRASTEEEWGMPVKLGPPVNGPSWEHKPSISPDGLSLYFPSNRQGGCGGLDLWVSSRLTTSEPWGDPVNLGPAVNSSAWDLSARVSADGLQLLFHSARSGGLGGEDIWMSTRATKEAPWGAAVNLGAPVNSSSNDGEAVLSADGLALFFNSDRGGGSGNYDLWMTRRRSASDPWGSPVNLGPWVNGPNVEWCGSLSADGSALYFCSDRPSTWGPCSIYQTKITPLTDLNGDEIVDSADVMIMIEHWQSDDPLCDIGPMPWGDGIVDAEDMKVLAEHLFQEVDDLTLIAHWPLDEAQGLVARDVVFGSDGALVGEPVWQSEGGAAAGALELDGIDDHVKTAPVLNPAEQPFSVFAWTKGGAAGQVILSQIDGCNWLCMGSGEGNLMTELQYPGRVSVGPLCSQSNISDGEWHRIGFVWDGSYRYLYVDGLEVARDTLPLGGLESAGSGLYFGADGALTGGSFFCGLIDDVRIYDRVVSP